MLPSVRTPSTKVLVIWLCVKLFCIVYIGSSLKKVRNLRLAELEIYLKVRHHNCKVLRHQTIKLIIKKEILT